MTSLASDGVVRAFEKPLSTTFLMFLAMAMSLPLYLIYTNTSMTDTHQGGKVTPRTRRSHWKVRCTAQRIDRLFFSMGGPA
jgi:hypothetical protein